MSERSDPVQGVLFDLYGTLVLPFRRREHEIAIAQCAEMLDLPFDVCHRTWVETFPERVRGAFADVAANLAACAAAAGYERDQKDLELAEAAYQAFTREGMAPIDGALELLATLQGLGIKIGLVTNCAPDIPAVWPTTAMAPFFDACAFSCVVGAVKPQAEIYLHAMEALDLDPRHTLFVGDGSDNELTGAAACGLRPLLVTPDLSNTYDGRRQDVDEWEGERAPRLLDVLGFLSPTAA